MSKSITTILKQGALKKRLADRFGRIRDFAYFSMWAGSHISSLDDLESEKLFASVEPAIRRALRNSDWTQRKGKLKVSVKNLVAAKPTIKRLTSEALIVQLDAIVHQTLNDVQNRPGKDRWFEEDIKAVLETHAVAKDKLFLVVESERYRDIVLLALVRNVLVHGQEVTKVGPTDVNVLDDGGRLRGFAKSLLEHSNGGALSWSGLVSKSYKISSVDDVIKWYQEELQAIIERLAYDDYFRFYWAAKTMLNAMISPPVEARRRTKRPAKKARSR